MSLKSHTHAVARFYADDFGHTVREACAIAGISRATLYRRAADGQLRIVKSGRCTVVPNTALLELLRSSAEQDATI